MRGIFLGFTGAGVLFALAVFAWLPAYDNPRITPVTSADQDGTVTESFFFRSPEDGIAVTHSGRLPLGIAPPGVAALSEPAIDRGFAFIVNMHDANGAVIGFATELEVHPEGDMLAQDLRWETEWVLVIPGRGVLVLNQQEHSGELGAKVINTIRATGKDWVGDWTVQTTVGPLANGRGLVMGGTGEFEGAAGSFIEIDHLTRYTAAGVMMGDFELRVAWEPRK
jgi:hypothetical protein